jgi:hypothetical protein
MRKGRGCLGTMVVLALWGWLLYLAVIGMDPDAHPQDRAAVEQALEEAGFDAPVLEVNARAVVTRWQSSAKVKYNAPTMRDSNHHNAARIAEIVRREYPHNVTKLEVWAIVQHHDEPDWESGLSWAGEFDRDELIFYAPDTAGRPERTPGLVAQWRLARLVRGQLPPWEQWGLPAAVVALALLHLRGRRRTTPHTDPAVTRPMSAPTPATPDAPTPVHGLDLLHAWDELVIALERQGLSVNDLPRLTGVPWPQIDQLRRVRNQCAHPAQYGWPNDTDVHAALALARSLRTHL